MPICLPEKCYRGLSNCRPLSSIECSDEDEKGIPNSYICTGLNDGSELKPDPNVQDDRITVCWHNKYVDSRDFWSKRDIIDTLSVFSQALSVLENDIVSYPKSDLIFDNEQEE